MRINLLALPKSAKLNALSKAPLYLRISVNNQRSEISLGHFIYPSDWDKARQSVKGKGKEANSINEQIATVKLRIQNIYTEHLRLSQEITAAKLKAAYMGIDTNSKSLVEVFNYHNVRIKEQIDKGYAKGTHQRYETVFRLLILFIQSRYKKEDIPLSKIDLEFITEFDHYLRVERGCCNNTAVKYIKNFKKIIRQALAFEWIKKDPFANYRAKLEQVEREALHQHEIDLIANKEFDIERLENIKNLFVFSCYSGLSYADLKELSPSNIIIGVDGKNWINFHRKKTNSPCKIPLLAPAYDILKKYVDHPKCLQDKTLFPVPSNQKVNAYLKEIGDICGLKKDLHFHLSRHTFATTVLLSNNVPMDTTSTLLGHSLIKTTQQYAKVKDKKICSDMSHLYNIYPSNQILSNLNAIV